MKLVKTWKNKENDKIDKIRYVHTRKIMNENKMYFDIDYILPLNVTEGVLKVCE